MKRRALVSGGTRGIGAAIAAALREAGNEVTITGRQPRRTKPSGYRYWACDFEDTAAVDALAQQVASERFDILVNNAGINKIGPSESYAMDDFSRIQQVNLLAPFRLCQAVIPGMRERKFGRIVNITSIFSLISKAGRAAYSASKSGLAGMTRALALETATDNVLVNALAAGFVDTELSRSILKESGMREVTARIPMGRFAKPEEIAAWAVFLVSPANTYMTGQNIVVDGGVTCG